MRLESVNQENTKMLSVLDTATAKALVGMCHNNRELGLLVQLYNYAKELNKNDDNFLGELTKKVNEIKYKELESIKEKASFIDENVDPTPFTAFFEGHRDLLDKIRFIQDNYNYKNNTENPILFMLAQLDKENKLLEVSAGEWLETHLERFKVLIEKTYNNLYKKSLVKSKEICKMSVKEILKQDFPSHTSKIQQYLIFKEGYNPNDSYYSDKNVDTYRKVNKYYADYLDKKYSKEIKEFNPFLKRITYKSMVEDYFGNGFELKEGKNAPRLSRQLTKAKIDYTDGEIRHFGEVKVFWEKWYEQFRTFTGEPFKTHGIYIDTENFNIPNIVDRFAFKDSCNNSQSGAGRDTHLILRELGMQYLKGYSLYKYNGKIGFVPSFRTYFYKKDNEIAHAGSYSDGFDDYNYLNYEFTTVLLAILFNRKIDDFSGISGMSTSCRTYYDSYDNGYNFWSNMGDNDYSKFGTADILEDIDGMDIEGIINKADFVRISKVISNMDEVLGSSKVAKLYKRKNSLIPLTENIHNIFY